MPTRRIMELALITGILLWPARQTVRTWAKRQLAAHPQGHFLHATGEVVVSIL